MTSSGLWPYSRNVEGQSDMLVALERTVIPAIGYPARPGAEDNPQRLNISVIFTSVDSTLAALKTAGMLASSLGANYARRTTDCAVPTPSKKSASVARLE